MYVALVEMNERLIRVLPKIDHNSILWILQSHERQATFIALNIINRHLYPRLSQLLHWGYVKKRNISYTINSLTPSPPPFLLPLLLPLKTFDIMSTPQSEREKLDADISALLEIEADLGSVVSLDLRSDSQHLNIQQVCQREMESNGRKKMKIDDNIA